MHIRQPTAMHHGRPCPCKAVDYGQLLGMNPLRLRGIRAALRLVRPGSASYGLDSIRSTTLFPSRRELWQPMPTRRPGAAYAYAICPRIAGRFAPVAAGTFPGS